MHPTTSSSRPIFHFIGNAHLDPAWMWQWGEGLEAFIATCRSAVELMDETPGYIFTCGSAAHYAWLEAHDPELFDRIGRRVKEGRWAVVGGWWVQADCNLPSGEGFLRQALLGQRYFLDRFGVAARTGFSPDAFGHNRGLPQLLAHAGMRGYVVCRPDPDELSLPSPLLDWRSPDGSTVLFYRVPYHYNLYETSIPQKVNDLLHALESRSELTQAEALGRFGQEWALYYGVGNHGGGPTREHLAQIEALRTDPSAPHVAYSDPDNFFDAVERRREERTIPTWDDDLQLDAPGCYSAHSQIKKLNRTSEYRLLQAETLASLDGMLTHAAWPGAELHRAWENICFNHFHDILCGVAIREALEDAVAMYGEALAIAARVARSAVQRLALRMDTSGKGITVVMFNSHSWDLNEPIIFELWDAVEKSRWSEPVMLQVTDDAGRQITSQSVQSSGRIGRDRIAVLVRARIPALGWRSYRVHLDTPAAPVESAVQAGEWFLDNGIVRIEVDEVSGAISRIHLHGREIARACAMPIVIEDGTDTWGHGVEQFDRVIGSFGDAAVRIVERGPVRAAIRVRSRWGSSWVQQEYRLSAGSDVVEVDVKLFWGEQNRMLKLEFTSDFLDARSVAQSAYSVTPKPCDGTERPCGTWCGIEGMLGDTAASLALVTDSKHGYSAHATDGRATLRVSVLRSPAYALHAPHRPGPDEDLDYLDQGIQRFRYEIVASNAALDPAELTRRGAQLCAPVIAHVESAHAPITVHDLPREYRGVRVTPPALLVGALKRAEDGPGWIVRVHNAGFEEARGRIELPTLNAATEVMLRPLQVATLVAEGGEWAAGDAMS